jgi:hypothetical protein
VVGILNIEQLAEQLSELRRKHSVVNAPISTEQAGQIVQQWINNPGLFK